MVGKVILGTVATAGLISMAVLAPNAVQCIKMFYPDQKRKYNSEWYVKTCIGRMTKQGFIKFEERNGKKFAKLTKKGREKLLRYQLKELVIKKPKRWDKKWRVAMLKTYFQIGKDVLSDVLSELILYIKQAVADFIYFEK